MWFRGEAIVCERFLNSSDGSSEVDPPDYLGGVTVFEIGLSLARWRDKIVSLARLSID